MILKVRTESLRLALSDRTKNRKKTKSSEAPCLELREGKIRLKGSSFLVLSPNLPKACGRSLQTLPAYDNEGQGLHLDTLAMIRTDKKRNEKEKDLPQGKFTSVFLTFFFFCLLVFYIRRKKEIRADSPEYSYFFKEKKFFFLFFRYCLVVLVIFFCFCLFVFLV